MREAVIVRDNQGTLLLTGWRDATWPRLWRIALLPGESNLPSVTNDAKQATLAAYSAYDLPSVAALIRYFHAAEVYPVRSTWLKSNRRWKLIIVEGVIYLQISEMLSFLWGKGGYTRTLDGVYHCK